MWQFFRKKWFTIFTIFILVLAGIIRFYNYPDRWGLAYDQAHDAIIAQYALSHFKLPLLGPFSSAGPFQTGGEWYWLIMLGSLIFSPFAIAGPWIFLTIMQIVFVGIMIYVGSKLGGKMLGVFTGILAAVSPGGVAQSVNLTNQAPIDIFSLLAILAVVLYMEKHRGWQMFFLGLSVGLATSIHLQGAVLGLFILAAIFFVPVKNIKHLLLLVLGGVLPLIPIFIVDFSNHFFNSKGFLQYYLHGQYKIPFDLLGRNWHTYALEFWPKALGNIIGNNKFMGIIVGLTIFLVMIYRVLLKQLTRIWIVILVSMGGFFVVLRYSHTPLFDSYLMFSHPFIFLVVGYSLFTVYLKNKWIGLVLLLIFVGTSIYKNILNIQGATNDSAFRSAYWSSFIAEKYPRKKFLIYDYKNRLNTYTYPLIFYMQRKGLLDENGYKIGFGEPTYEDDKLNYNVLTRIQGNITGFVFVDIESSSSAQLRNAYWYPVYPRLIYESTEEWYKNKVQ